MKGFLHMLFRSNFNIYWYISLLLLLNCKSISQTFKLTVKDPKNATVCQSSKAELSILNTSGILQSNIVVKLKLPPGINYIPGSIQGATEVNVSQLTSPEFRIDTIFKNDSISISILMIPSCFLFHKMDSTLKNTWVLNSSFGIDSAQSNPTYQVLTPLLLMDLKASTIDTTASTGASFKRTITIKNTRLGSLKNFIYENLHDNLEIGSQSGSLISQTLNHLKLEFDADDFLKIGDLDSLFERDEEIQIVEDIRQTSCEIEQIRSHFLAYWGCNLDTCQKDLRSALINFIKPNKLANILFVPNDNFPSCICSDTGTTQSLILRNIGEQTAENIEITIKMDPLNKDVPFGIVDRSVSITGPPQVIDIQYQTTGKCATGFTCVKITLGELAPGTEVRIDFKYMTCLDCQLGIGNNLFWYWDYSYASKCVPGSTVSGINRKKEVVNNNKPIFLDLKLKEAVDVLENHKTYTLQSQIKFPGKIENQTLILRFGLPCPLRIVDSTFVLNGKTPSKISISGDSTIAIELEYDAPFSQDQFLEFKIKVDCNFLCKVDQNKTSATNFISTCPNQQILKSSLAGKICFDAQLTCPYREFDCGLCKYTEYVFDLECNYNPTIKDSIFGYLEGTADVYRKNYGVSDPNNDRFPDPGILDKTLVKKKNFITGDTMNVDFKTIVISEDDRFHYDSLIFMINSDALSFDSLTTTVQTKIEILDQSTSKKYYCDYTIWDKTRSSNPIPNCANAVYNKDQYGKGIIIPISPEQLNLYGAKLPTHFKFEKGDSIYASISVKLNNHVEERILKIGLTLRAFLLDRTHLLKIPFSCMSIKDTIIQATQGIKISAQFDSLFICKTSTKLFSYKIQGTKSLENFFPYEFRSLYSFDSIRIHISNDNLILDSIQIRYSYENEFGNQAITLQSFPVIKINNRWEIESELLKQHRYDESYSIELIPYSHLVDCAQFVSTDNKITSTFYINEKNSSKFFNIVSATIIVDSIYDSKTNTVSLFNGNKRLNIPSRTIYSSTNKISWPFLISNLEISGGYEFEVYSRNKSLSNVSLNTIPNTKITKLDSFLFALDSIQSLQNYEVRFTADHSFCTQDTFMVISRWVCPGEAMKIKDQCNLDTFFIIIVPEMPELELDLKQDQIEAILCDTLPEIYLELYNANNGVACNVYLEGYIPPGIEIVPNSAVFSYPKGSPFKQLPTPILIGSNRYRWMFSDFIQEIKNNCLHGIKQAPLNSIEIKLKMISNCDAVVNSFPSFFTSGENHCGESTNSIAKTANLIQIKNLHLTGEFKINMDIQEPDVCADETLIHFSLFKNTTSTSSDSIKIVLPNGIHYVEKSLKNIKNMLPTAPSISLEGDNEVLSFGFASGIITNDSILFNIAIKGLKNILCKEQVFMAFTFNRLKTVCSITQAECDVLLASGSAELKFSYTTGSFSLDSFKLMKTLDSINYNLSFNYNLSGRSNIKDSIICIGFYEDQDADGKLSDADTLIKIININLVGNTQNGNFSYEDHIDRERIQGCYYLIASLAKNCLCELDTLPFKIKMQKEFLFRDSLCAGQSLKIGIESQNNKNYKWTSGTVLCDTCSQFIFTTPTSWSSDTSFHFTLNENDQTNCNAKYNFIIDVFSNPIGNFTVLESCPGERLNVNAGNRKNFTWSGPQISNPLNYNQEIINNSEIFLYLKFKNEHLCASEDTFQFLPLIDPNPIRILGDTLVLQGTESRYCIVGGKSILWEPNTWIDCNTCRCVKIKADHDLTYTITVLDSFDCPHILKLNLKILLPDCDSTTIFIPNAFSPNQDGNNDFLFVRSNTISTMQLGIYSRWGEKVFESFNILDGWDGRFKGKLLGPDVFGYFLKAECIGGKKYYRKGNISLLK
ncbi:MAG: gliding motility-associated C-terminal domain-containing protein [Saprospiraceae bacterium]